MRLNERKKENEKGRLRLNEKKKETEREEERE